MRGVRGNALGTRSRLRITFTPPEHGWLRLSIEAAGTCVDIDASYTPDDPVRQLIDALYTTTRGDAACVWWPLEPDGYFLHFEPNGERIRLRLDFAPDSEPARARNVLAIDGTTREILLPFWRFLRRFQSSAPHAPHWPDIDDRDLDVIGDRLRHPQSCDAESTPRESH